jgi:hypothetical protein
VDHGLPEANIWEDEMLSSQKMLSLIYPTAWPGLGHFSVRGDGFRFEPIAMDMRS